MQRQVCHVLQIQALLCRVVRTFCCLTSVAFLFCKSSFIKVHVLQQTNL